MGWRQLRGQRTGLMFGRFPRPACTTSSLPYYLRDLGGITSPVYVHGSKRVPGENSAGPGSSAVLSKVLILRASFSLSCLFLAPASVAADHAPVECTHLIARI